MLTEALAIRCCRMACGGATEHQIALFCRRWMMRLRKRGREWVVYCQLPQPKRWGLDVLGDIRSGG